MMTPAPATSAVSLDPARVASAIRARWVRPFGHPDLGRDSARHGRLIGLGVSPPRLLKHPSPGDWRPFPARLAAVKDWHFCHIQ